MDAAVSRGPSLQDVEEQSMEQKVDLLLAKFEAFSQQQQQLLHDLVQRLSAAPSPEIVQRPKRMSQQLVIPEKGHGPTRNRQRLSVDMNPDQSASSVASIVPSVPSHSTSSEWRPEEGHLAQGRMPKKVEHGPEGPGSAGSKAKKAKSVSVMSQSSASVLTPSKSSTPLAAAWHGEIRSRQQSVDDRTRRTLSSQSLLSVPSVREMNSAFMHAIAETWRTTPPWHNISGQSPGDGPEAEVGSPASAIQRPAHSAGLSSVDNPVAAQEPEAEDSPELPNNLPARNRELNLPGLMEVTPVSSSADRMVSGPLRASGGTVANGQAVTMVNLTHHSQALIIDKFNTAAATEVPPLEQDVGCRLALNFPRVLYGILVFFSLAQCGVMVALKVLGYVESVGYSFAMAASVLYSLSATICIYLLRRALSSDDLAAAMSNLHMFVAQCTVHWKRLSSREAQRLAVVWVLLVIAFALCHALEEWKVQAGLTLMPKGTEDIKILRHVISVMSVLSFCISSAMVVIVAYVQSHLLLGMDKCLDCWCCIILEAGDFQVGVESWNALQAMLKSIGRELASSFLAAQLLGAVGFVYFLTSCVTYAFQSSFAPDRVLMEACSAVPLLCLFGLGLRVFSHGAALTEKCRVIPSFVNQIPSEEVIDPERQYLAAWTNLHFRARRF
ncbi:unnamed protein product [Symbiodinium sp. CCMP2592]|nr:unnamed protein product [Symbiodinium sp. CCMP2592]